MEKEITKDHYENGKLKSEGEFKPFTDCTSRGSGTSILENNHDFCVECIWGTSSRKIGKWKYYHENGKLKMEGEYNGLDNSVEDWDVRYGVWKTYDKTGKLSNKLTYKNGEIV